MQGMPLDLVTPQSVDEITNTLPNTQPPLGRPEYFLLGTAGCS